MQPSDSSNNGGATRTMDKMTVQEMKEYLARQGVETEVDLTVDRLYVTHIRGWPSKTTETAFAVSDADVA